MFMRTLIGCCLIHLCIGSVYAMSVLYKPIIEHTGWGINVLVYGFALTILTLGLVASFHQKLFAHVHKKEILLNAAILWGIASCLIVDVAIQQPEIGKAIYYALSIVTGACIGLLYVIPINIIGNYGYKRVGMTSGLVVTCFGLGSVIASKLFSIITLENLIAIYLIYVITLLFGIWLIEGNDTIESPGDYHCDKTWYAIATVFFLNIGVGISLLSNLTQLSLDTGMNLAEAVGLVAMAGIANSGGRLIYSTASDWLGKVETLVIVLALQLCALVVILHSSYWYIPVLIVISVYGGVFSIMPSLMKEIYHEQGSIAYSKVLSMWGFAGLVCPILFTQYGMELLVLMSSLTLICMAYAIRYGFSYQGK